MPAARRETAQAEWPPEFRPHLSPVATEFLRKHPDQAERVITEALEAAANRPDPEVPEVPAYRIPEHLRRFVAQAPEPQAGLLNITEAAERLKVSRPTVYAWIKAKRLLAWPLTPTGAVIPAEQILGSETLVPGMERVLEILPDPRLAWSFLTQELPFFAGAARRPIDVLKEGDVQAVLEAADAYGSDFM